ncbi:RsmE family RNA methyltransferase [Desulfobotulus sp.]|uniref:RsmE family RNA methyltransferase n=1 Tax=Desulfobotulus sp. TaxID=1940337 RepID=UPI002A36502D|nr:RsmE family RNA methyltransferase [Desulfobotulus sp.]MDY0163173.1 RsmE family RNA methyltransferase [Desulfobotulus sp.]
MDRKEKCLNGGGPPSRILLGKNPGKLGEAVAFSGEAAQALSAWAARPGEILTVSAPDGRLFRARMVGERGRLEAAVCFEDLGLPPVEPELFLCPALPEKERFELVLEKATELGVDGIFPFVSRRSSTLQMRDAGQKKSHRWPQLLQRASRQCRRPCLPALFPVGEFSDLLSFLDQGGLCVVLDERERERSLAEALGSWPGGTVVLVTGPEGGWERDEVAALGEVGTLAVSLGSRILRTETAAILAVGLVRHGRLLGG